MQGGMPHHAAKLLSPRFHRKEKVETDRSLYTEYAIELQAVTE